MEKKALSLLNKNMEYTELEKKIFEMNEFFDLSDLLKFTERVKIQCWDCEHAFDWLYTKVHDYLSRNEEIPTTTDLFIEYWSKVRHFP